MSLDSLTFWGSFFFSFFFLFFSYGSPCKNPYSNILIVLLYPLFGSARNTPLAAHKIGLISRPVTLIMPLMFVYHQQAAAFKLNGTFAGGMRPSSQ